jgi:hypothetical protein
LAKLCRNCDTHIGFSFAYAFLHSPGFYITRSNHRLGSRFVVGRREQSSVAETDRSCSEYVRGRCVGRFIAEAFSVARSFALCRGFVHLHACSVSFFPQGFADTSKSAGHERKQALLHQQASNVSDRLGNRTSL